MRGIFFISQKSLLGPPPWLLSWTLLSVRALLLAYYGSSLIGTSTSIESSN